MTTGHSAPLSAVALKASAGAAEVLPLILARQPLTFLDKSKANGWKIYAADASEAPKPRGLRSIATSQLVNPLLQQPCILILGGEGEGIRDRVLQKADVKVRVAGQRSNQAGIDSLNVSVAAGLLIEAFLRRSNSLSSDYQANINDKDDNYVF